MVPFCNGNQDYVRTIVPGSPEGVINTHNYQAMYYEDGSYAGINEIVFNFKPWLDWYLQTTGQRLVGGSGPFAPAGGHGSADATSGASDAGGHGDGGARRCRCNFWCSTNKKMKLRASFFYCNSLMIFLASSF